MMSSLASLVRVIRLLADDSAVPARREGRTRAAEAAVGRKGSSQAVFPGFRTRRNACLAGVLRVARCVTTPSRRTAKCGTAADGHTPGVIAAVAAGHPATADAGLEILAAGGSAADAAVAASLASCAAETIMTGLLGGGHAIYWDAAEARARNLDFFVAVPGSARRRASRTCSRSQCRSARSSSTTRSGRRRALFPACRPGSKHSGRRTGGSRGPRLVEPALRIARDGALLTPAHAAVLAMLAPVFTMHEGARSMRPTGRCCRRGDTSSSRARTAPSRQSPPTGPRAVYTGPIADGAARALRRARRPDHRR